MSRAKRTFLSARPASSPPLSFLNPSRFDRVPSPLLYEGGGGNSSREFSARNPRGLVRKGCARARARSAEETNTRENKRLFLCKRDTRRKEATRAYVVVAESTKGINQTRFGESAHARYTHATHDHFRTRKYVAEMSTATEMETLLHRYTVTRVCRSRFT